LTNGQIITNAYEVYQRNTSTSSISGHNPIHSSSSSSFINGNLRRKITTGAYQFPLGTTAGNYEIGIMSQIWNDTSVVNQIQIAGNSNFTSAEIGTGSVFTLFGIKGA
jgi:hypothetical protein